jgi:beta-galactosidase
MPFQDPQMRLFSGAATAIVRSSATAGTLTFRAKASGVKSATLTLPIR